MPKTNLVKENQSFFQQLKKNAIKRDIVMDVEWAKRTIALALKYFLQIEE